jgi:hypothetical protein
VTVGEEAAGPELADELTNVVGLLSINRPALTDPLVAGAELGRVLGDRRVELARCPAHISPAESTAAVNGRWLLPGRSPGGSSTLERRRLALRRD